MRPEVLTLEGFTTFRDHTVVDFRGCDLFALSGATGAGKSSIIDAICFALYGVVPRYDDRRLVAPVLSQGALEAKVQLDFTVGGAHYRVARVVRAGTGSRGGASTKEARLELVAADDSTDVLAGTADEVTASVTDLLGLTFEHFTTCVVLPQGEFARFLHAKPKDRQQLLVELLDLGVYGRAGQLARSRQKELEGRRAATLDQLGKLLDYTPESLATYEARVAELEAMLDAIDAAHDELDALAERVREADARAAAADEAVQALAVVVVPPEVGELGARRAEAEASLVAARAKEDEAGAALESAEAALAAAPSTDEATALLAAHDDLATARERIANGTPKVAAAVAAHEAASAALASARAARDEAESRLAAARTADQALALAATLVVGEPCPVCAQTVTDIPEHHADDLRALEAALTDARAEVDDAEAAERRTAEDRTTKQALLAQLYETEAALVGRLADAPTVEELRAVLDSRQVLEAAVQQARAAEKQARDARAEAEKALKACDDAERDARVEFGRVRDGLAALGPPAAGHTDLAADWASLAEWAAEQLPRQRDAAAAHRADAVAARRAHDERIAGLVARATATDLDVRPDRDLRDVVVEALAQARTDVASIRDGIEQAAAAQTELDQLTLDEKLAADLGRHLSAKGFEKWLLDEVLRRLVTAATGILTDLSSGAYSLTLDAKTSDFAVVDHTNADTVRSARTLSGGETFLASLALALALADEVANLAAGGAARLEAIFLDEGFGTLDPDTLDVVVGAIEELGARGRMVGLVSHVRELAERLAVRFDVTKGPTTSVVERVEQ